MKDRVKLIMSVKNLSPADFSEALQVQRSSISHILSGRNKPSLDFMLKITEAYPDLSLDWLMKGEGPMFKRQVEASKDVYKPKSTEKLPLDLFEDDEVLQAQAEQLKKIAKKEPLEASLSTTNEQQAELPAEAAQKRQKTSEKIAEKLANPPLATENTVLAEEAVQQSEADHRVLSAKQLPSEKTLVAWMAIYSDNSFKMYYPQEKD